MKNFKWILFFAVILILISPFLSSAQTAIEASQQPGLFQKVGTWIQSNLIGVGTVFVFGIMAKEGWSLAIKSIANKGATITKEVGEFFTDSSVFLSTLDNAIKADGTIEQNSVKELLAAGKEVLAEGKDVIISIKPRG
ncbi:MAG: hypothetical protein JZU49_01200 [Sulfuricurvum sp.]|jgi:hypothetical protein|nr:hypothetical protein [Sulfuricurvum sp.]